MQDNTPVLSKAIGAVHNTYNLHSGAVSLVMAAVHINLHIEVKADTQFSVHLTRMGIIIQFNVMYIFSDLVAFNS